MDREQTGGTVCVNRSEPLLFRVRRGLVARLGRAREKNKGDHAHGSDFPRPETASQILW